MSDQAAAAPANGFGPLEGARSRGPEATITGLEIDVDPEGDITRFELDCNADIIDLHHQVRITIMGPLGFHFDALVELNGIHEWYDLAVAIREGGLELPRGLTEPGTQVRVAPYSHDEPLQSQELLALQVPLQGQSGRGRYIYGEWEAEWPGSLWNSGVVTGVDGQLRRAFVIATSAIDEQLVSLRVFEVGHAEHPLLESQPGDGAATVAWESGGFIGIELTPTIARIPWTSLREAVLEMDALPPGEPDADPRRLHVPITAR